MTDLNGKTALITGSVQGIGLAIAESLAEAGARIAVHGIAGDAQVHEVCEHLRDKGSPQAEFFRGDLRHPDQIDAMMDAVEAWGGVDILVNNAGIQHTAPLAENFDIEELGEHGGLRWLELSPKSKDTSFSYMRTAMEGEMLRAMEMVDGFGNTTRLYFVTMDQNPPLDEEKFQFTPPPGVDVIGEVEGSE